MNLKFSCIFLIIITTSSCSTLQQNQSNLCTALNTYSQTIPKGETRELTFGRGGLWMVDHYTYCGGKEGDEAVKSFCSWVAQNTSSEFMEANINQALSCLQRQKIKGFIGNTGVNTWSGKISFYYTQAVPDTEVTLEYNKAQPATADESYMKFTLTKAKQ